MTSAAGRSTWASTSSAARGARWRSPRSFQPRTKARRGRCSCKRDTADANARRRPRTRGSARRPGGRRAAARASWRPNRSQGAVAARNRAPRQATAGDTARGNQEIDEPRRSRYGANSHVSVTVGHKGAISRVCRRLAAAGRRRAHRCRARAAALVPDVVPRGVEDPPVDGPLPPGAKRRTDRGLVGRLAGLEIPPDQCRVLAVKR